MRATNFENLLIDYKLDYQQAKALSAAMLACNAMIVPDEAPEIALLITNFPRPMSTFTDPAAYSYAGGLQAHRAGVPKTSFDSTMQFIETDSGQIQGFSELCMANGGTINCTVFDGRKDRHTLAYELTDVAITFEQGEIDSESTGTILKISAPIKYMYFGINAQIGTTATSPGKIQASGDGIQKFIDKSNSILNAVRAGNNLLNAIGAFA